MRKESNGSTLGLCVVPNHIMSHLLVNVLGQIQGVCRINIPCLVIGTREYLGGRCKVILQAFSLTICFFCNFDLVFPYHKEDISKSRAYIFRLGLSKLGYHIRAQC